MKTSFRGVLRISPLLLLLNCITPVDLPVEYLGGQLVISGQVSSLPDRTQIQIGRTAYKQLPHPETGATITLYDDDGPVQFLYETITPGNYVAYGFKGIPGRTYHVEISLSTGRVYRSEPETMPPFSPPIEVKHEFAERVTTNSEGANLTEKFVDVYVSTELPSEWQDRYLSWTVEEVYLLSPTDFPDPFGSIPPPCYVNQKAEPNRVALLNATRLKTDKIENQLVCSRIVDRSFLEKHYLITYQSAISKQAYEYWRKVNILANQTGSIFDTPPAQVLGNIESANSSDEKIWGYFQASTESYNRFVLFPTDFPYRIFFPYEECTFSYSRTIEYPSYCLDCLSMRNSSYYRPDWF